MTNSVVIQLASSADVPAMTDVHRKAFPSFFLTSLGTRTLRVFYTHVLESPTGIALVANDRDSGECVGLVAGTLDLPGFRAEQKGPWLIRYSTSAAPAVARSPRKAQGLITALRSADPAGSTTTACLMSLAVLPNRAGAGIGSQLVGAFNAELRSHGQDTYSLTTDAESNESTNRFYQSLGFRLIKQWARSDGRKMNAYEIDLSSRQPRPAR